MGVELERRRLLLAARPAETSQLLSLFLQAPLERWDVQAVESFERARFLLQHNPFDILLVDESLYHTAGEAGLAWLTRQQEVPTIFMTGLEPETIAQAYAHGVSLCLPRQMALAHAGVMSAALARMAQVRERERICLRTRDNLHQCRRQVDRLVNLLWRTAPTDPERQWLTHRHILERLQEEVCRSGRHGNVFTVAIGEVQTGAEVPEQADLGEWTTNTLARIKRRCDVAGHYGLQGFMLLMVQTPKPGAVTCCKRLQQYLHQGVEQRSGPGRPLNACFGLSSFSPDNATTQSLLSKAEKHLEAAKAGVDGGIVAD